jgi:hypothetical protein
MVPTNVPWKRTASIFMTNDLEREREEEEEALLLKSAARNSHVSH